MGLARANKLLGRGGRVSYPPMHPNCRCWLKPTVSEVLLKDAIGNILAGQFFARAHEYGVVIG
jgi:hypothetical protein